MINKFLSFIAIALLCSCSADSLETPDGSENSLAGTATHILSENTPSTTKSGLTPQVVQTKQSASLPDDIVITLSREGGIAGIHEIWTIFADGLIFLPSGDTFMIPEEELNALLLSVDESGLLSLEPVVGSPICCDFFTYTAQLKGAELDKTISFSEGDPDSPEAFWELVNNIQQIVGNLEAN